MRTFEIKPAKRERVPLLLGLVGASGSGKTYSALRLATGMQRVIGGPIVVIDTEAKRALACADWFRFEHIPFEPPHGPLDYLEAIRAAVAHGSKIIVVDSMTHEHSGVGGVLDQAEAYIQAKIDRDRERARGAVDEDGIRKRNLMAALIEPKRARKRLITEILQLGVNLICCYRAADKIKPVRGSEPEHLGWQAETTSPLIYEMQQQWLLTPGCKGVPTTNPGDLTRAEGMLVKSPRQFEGWFDGKTALSEEIGERMALWAMGDEVPSIEAQLAACRTREDVLAVYRRAVAANPSAKDAIDALCGARANQIKAEGGGQ